MLFFFFNFKENIYNSSEHPEVAPLAQQLPARCRRDAVSPFPHSLRDPKAHVGEELSFSTNFWCL